MVWKCTSKGRTTAHQGTAGWRAGWADMKVVKPCALCPEGVEVGGADAVIAQAGEISFTLIISQDEENIGAAACKFWALAA